LDKIFAVELSNDNPSFWYSVTLELPATGYELLDALDKLHMNVGKEPTFEILDYGDFHCLQSSLDCCVDFYNVNALSMRLSELDETQRIAFKGLVQIELEKTDWKDMYRCIPTPRLIDLAYSADCCHVVREARNDAQLGRFYAKNGFISELDGLPDGIFELLDFEKIGREARQGEGGTFTSQGYVVQSEELKQVYDTLDLRPRKPDYIFRLLLTNHEDGSGAEPIPLELPAPRQKLEDIQRELGTPDWLGAEIVGMDGPLPMLKHDLFYADQIDELNDLSQRVRQLAADGKLKQYKAVLTATDCHEIETAISLADTVDDYVLSSRVRTMEDLARAELKVIVDQKSAELLIPNLNLYAYGKDILAQDHSVITDYGLIERRDGQPILTQSEIPTQEMQML
jgi:hypothetical protein